MRERRDYNDKIIADWTSVELDATWGQVASRWERLVAAGMRTRHAVAVFACAAVFAVVFAAGVRAHHTEILVVAISSITLMAICTEFIGGKFYGPKRSKREAQPCDAPQDERASG